MFDRLKEDIQSVKDRGGNLDHTNIAFIPGA